MSFIFALFCLSLGFSFIRSAIVDYRKSSSVVKEGNRTIAIIVEVIREESEDNDGKTSVSYWPIYEFENIYSQVVSYRPSSTTDLVDYNVGDKVAVAYLPDEEDQVVILTNNGKYADVWWMTIGGIIFIGCGLGIISTTSWYKSLLHIGLIINFFS
ncbi:MAG: hypothetical protein ACJATI_001041 [Halioglobus sp.]|jgi:hypothetical protein